MVRPIKARVKLLNIPADSKLDKYQLVPVP